MDVERSEFLADTGTGLDKSQAESAESASVETIKGRIPCTRPQTDLYLQLARSGEFTIASSDPLPRGSCAIRFDFAYDGVGPGKGGTGTLSVNEKTVAEGRLEKRYPSFAQLRGVRVRRLINTGQLQSIKDGRSRRDLVRVGCLED